LGLNAADTTDCVCPLSVRARAPLRASHTFAVSSKLPVTMREPSGVMQWYHRVTDASIK
jgi:hypothetical protein